MRLLAEQGVAHERIALDPGIGFGKTPAHNLDLLRGSRNCWHWARPLLVGWSRKSTLGHLTGRPVDERLAASLDTSAPTASAARWASPPITPDFVLRLGHAVGQVLKRTEARPTVLIGKDTRISGYMLERRSKRAFSAAGVDVLLTGPMPTPASPTSRARCARSAGVVISASHNPFDDNGIKFFSARRREAARRMGARSKPRWTEPTWVDSPPRSSARPSAATTRRPLHRVLQEHLSERADAQGPEDRGGLRARRRLPRRAARVPRARRRGDRHRLEPDGFNINDGVGATHPEALAAVREHQAPTSASRSTATATAC
jgi:hypothetical protein